MSKENFVTCPIDRHKCRLPECIEYEGTKEQPCIASVKYLANAAVHISKINFALSVYENIHKPTLEEIQNSVNISEALIEVSKRLNINPVSLMEKVIKKGAVKIEKKIKKI